MTKENSIVIVGGGLTGLAAAVSAAQRGAEVFVAERTAELGGRGRSEVEDGYVLNLGPHALFPRAQELLAQLGVDARGEVPSNQGFTLRIGERLHPMPTGPLSILSNDALSFSGKWALTRLLGQVMVGRGQARFDGKSVDEWLEGAPSDARGIMEAFIRLTTYTHGPERMSAGAAMRQLGGGLDVRYLHDGWQQLVDALVTRARALGVEIRTRASVEALDVENGALRAVRIDGERLPCRAMIVTLSPKASVSLLAEHASTELVRFAEQATPVRAACLDVALRSLPRSSPTLILGVERPTYFSIHSRTAKLAPDEGAVIHVSRYLAPEEKVDPAALRADMEAELDQVQPGWREVLVQARFSPALRVSNALVEASRGGLAGRPPVHGSGVDGVMLAGDWVGARGMLFDAALESACEAVDLLFAQAFFARGAAA